MSLLDPSGFWKSLVPPKTISLLRLESNAIDMPKFFGGCGPALLIGVQALPSHAWTLPKQSTAITLFSDDSNASADHGATVPASAFCDQVDPESSHVSGAPKNADGPTSTSVLRWLS